ncbi:lysylphosphatidylglycerol synthase transmembrane domain-containing protein [Halosimplex carlsbadense]|uniref:lysylphosphatidylglycerol synthase transmembrane domain-containing protein n=1 Tax=Halosimplex carlsbadense TaxID=171164 RepID=UPI0009E52FD2|nr:lysylphosphatidylglycerol synthase transmembrane domain-containing protein [Halosimplex carlsbadense]
MTNGNTPSDPADSAESELENVPSKSDANHNNQMQREKLSRLKQFALKILKYGIAVGAFAYILQEIDHQRIITLLASLDVIVLVAIIVITILEFGSRFSSWHVLLNGQNKTRFLTAVYIDLVIKSINHVVPSKVSGHSVAPVVIHHYTDTDWPEAVTIAGLNTALYAILYGTITLIGSGLLATKLPRGLLVIIVLSTAMYLTAGIVVLLAGRRLDSASVVFSRLQIFIKRLPAVGEKAASLVSKLPSFTSESAALFRNLSANPTVVIPYALAWAGTLMIFPGLRVWLLFEKLGSTFTPAWLLPLVLVMAYSVTILPLTPGGVGVAEASATLVFVSLGVSEEVAVAAILIDRSLGVYLPAFLGWFPMMNLNLADMINRAR